MKLLTTILSLIALPLLLLEYFALFWLWAGDGIYTLVSVPVCYLLFLALCLLLIQKSGPIRLPRVLLVEGIALILPFVTVAAVWGLAWIWGIPISIA